MLVINYSETRNLLNKLSLNDLGIDTLMKRFPEEIKLIENPPAGKDCLEWLLGITDQRLLEDKYDFIKDGTERTGDLVMYSDHFGDEVLHIGKYLGNGRVLSKWGPGNPVFEHPLELVPNIYGEMVFFLREKSAKVD